MKRQLVRKKPYKITGDEINGLKVQIHALTDLRKGDYVHEYKNDDGSVLIVPVKD